MKIAKFSLLLALTLSLVLGGYWLVDQKYQPLTREGLLGATELTSASQNQVLPTGFIEDKQQADLRNETYGAGASVSQRQAEQYEQYLEDVLLKRQRKIPTSPFYNWSSPPNLGLTLAPKVQENVVASARLLELHEPNYGAKFADRSLETSSEYGDFHPQERQNVVTVLAKDQGYSFLNSRRFLAYGKVPPSHTVKTEDFINAFDYDFASTSDFSIAGNSVIANMETFPSPWRRTGKILRASVLTQDFPRRNAPLNVIFLIDRSVSMFQGARLSLLQETLPQAAARLGKNDTLTVLSYADDVLLNLPPMRNPSAENINQVLFDLHRGSKLKGKNPLIEIYGLAAEMSRENRRTHIIIVTDDDYNLAGLSSSKMSDFQELIETDRVSTAIYSLGPSLIANPDRDRVVSLLRARSFILETQMELLKRLQQDLFFKSVLLGSDLRIQIKFSEEVKSWRLLGAKEVGEEIITFMGEKQTAHPLYSGDDFHLLFEVIPAEGVKDFSQNFVSMLASYQEMKEVEQLSNLRIISGKLPIYQQQSPDMYFMVLVAAVAQYLGNDPSVFMQSYERLVRHLYQAVKVLEDPQKTDFLQMVLAVQNATEVQIQ